MQQKRSCYNFKFYTSLLQCYLISKFNTHLCMQARHTLLLFQFFLFFLFFYFLSFFIHLFLYFLSFLSISFPLSIYEYLPSLFFLSNLLFLSMYLTWLFLFCTSFLFFWPAIFLSFCIVRDVSYSLARKLFANRKKAVSFFQPILAELTIQDMKNPKITSALFSPGSSPPLVFL